MVYLLVNTFKGWTLQGANVCRATDASLLATWRVPHRATRQDQT